MNYVGLILMLLFSLWWIAWPESVIHFYQALAHREIAAPPTYQIRIAGVVLAAAAIAIIFL